MAVMIGTISAETSVPQRPSSYAATEKENKATRSPQRMVQAEPAQTSPPATASSAATGPGLSKDASLASGFLPYAPRSEHVADLLVAHIANIRGTSPREVSDSYRGLEQGFRLVFRRELCLRHKHLPTDHKGKRPLQLLCHETLVQKVASPEDALKVLARLLEKGRAEAVRIAKMADGGRHPTGAFLICVSKLVEGAKDSSQLDIELRSSPDMMEAFWKAPPNVCLDNLTRIDSLEDVPNVKALDLKRPFDSCAFFGGGGGSDVVQAGAVAKLFLRVNRSLNVRAVISVRTLYSKSTSRGEKRSVWNAQDETAPRRNLLEESDGNLKIERYHRGNARFVEDAMTCDFNNVRLVIDDKSEENGVRLRRYAAAIPEGVDSLVIVDTGGDVLGGMDEPATKKTPNQDRRTQLATSAIATDKEVNCIVVIAALGVDAPPDAQAKLERCDAVYYRFTAGDKQYLTELYSKWQFNGSRENLQQFPERYGKTPFAMLASFAMKQGERGFHALPLPESVIDDFDNPWSCITWVTWEMSCMVLANQAKLLSVIAPRCKHSSCQDCVQVA